MKHFQPPPIGADALVGVQDMRQDNRDEDSFPRIGIGNRLQIVRQIGQKNGRQFGLAATDIPARIEASVFEKVDRVRYGFRAGVAEA